MRKIQISVKLIVEEELALTENAKRTKIADGTFSMVIQFGHCEREELTHCNSLKLYLIEMALLSKV